MITKQIRPNGEVVGLRENDHTIAGTGYQGLITATYKQLVEAFGEPSKGDGYKQDAQWVLLTPAGVVTVYNYKDGVNYCGKEDGTPTKKIVEWHIGGKDVDVVKYICRALGIEED